MLQSFATDLALMPALLRSSITLDGSSDAARVLQWEGIGRLRPGYRADLTIIDRNPFSCAVDDIAATKVLRTVFDGAVVHDDGSLPCHRI